MTFLPRLLTIAVSVAWFLGAICMATTLDMFSGVLLGASLGVGGLLLKSVAPQVQLNMRLLFEESPSALLLFRLRDGLIIDANPMAARHYRLPREQLRGRHLRDLDLPAALCERDVALGVPSPHQERRAAGELRHIMVTVNAIPWVGPQLRYAMIQDVTPETARERHMHAMIAAAMDAIIQIDGDQQIILANPAAEELFGYPVDQLIGQPLEILIPEPARPLHHTYARSFIQEGATMRHRSALPIFNARRRDGTTIPIEISLTTTCIDHQQITTAIMRDLSDRLQHEREQQALLEFTAALRATTTSIDLANTLASELCAQLCAPHLALLWCDEQTGITQVICGHGAWEQLVGQSEQAVSAEQCLALGESVAPPPPARLHIDGMMITDVQLKVHHQRVGALWLGRTEPFSPGDQRLLAALAEVGASALRRAQLNERLEHANAALRAAYDATIAGWARALDLRDRETEDHSRRVADLTVALAKQLGVPAAEIEHLRRGALLHDIGKMGVPDAILNKAGPLSDQERAIMQRHPADACLIIEPIEYLRPAIDIPRAHHERWDGSGYPAGLCGEEIPFAARIFAVVDVWDALTNDRPYRTAWDAAQALSYLQYHAGTMFDPQVVRAFVEMMRAE